MSRIGEGDFGWVAEQARRAAEAQAEARRLAEIERATALAAAALPALSPQNPAGPETLGRVLGEVQRMAAEARTGFAVEVARQSTPDVGLSPTPRDAASIVQALVDEAYPHTTDPRARLGQALVSFAGGNPAGVGPRVLEAAVSQALASLAPGPGAAPSPTPARDVLERRPGAERIGGGRFDPPRVAPRRNVVSAPVNDARAALAPITSPATAHTPVVASSDVASSKKVQAAATWAATSAGVAWSRVPAARDASVVADLDALSAALGGSRPAAPPPDAPAGVEQPRSWQQGRALAVSRLEWDEAAPRLLGANLTSLAGKAQSLYDKADRVRSLLLDAQGGGVPLRLGLISAAGALDKAALRAGTAHELLGLRDSPRDTLRALAAARDQLRGVHSEAQTAVEALSGFQARMHGLPAAVAEVRDIAREARTAEREVGTSFARGSMLEAADAGAGLYAEEPPPEVTAEAPLAEAAEGPGVLTEADLARVGSGLDPSKPAPQTVWSEGMVNTVCDLGRQQGGCTDADGARHFELARMALGTEGADLQGPGRPLEATDLAAVLKMAGVPLETVDPAQLQSAARYVSSATSLSDQQDKLRKTLDNFQVLGTIGLPKLSRQQMVEELWGMAKVPGHALQKLSDAEIQKKFQEVAGALNAGPGRSEIKIGKHTLKLELGESGQVLSTSCKQPSFLSKVWGVVKTVAPIALTVASLVFTGGTTLAIIKMAQAALSAVQAIKSKSLLGIAAAGAALVGGAAGLVNKGAGLAGRVATTAQSVSRSLQGVASIRRGDLLGGIASIGSGVAGGIAGVAGKMSEGLTKFSNQLSFYSNKLSALGAGVAAMRGYTSASKALDEARRMVAQARASGDPRQVAAAEKQLRQAESQKRTSIFGSAAGALSAASLWVGDRAEFEGAPKLGPADPGLASQLQLLSRGFGVARDVSGHDYLSAAVGGLSVASNVDSARHGGSSTSLTDASRIAEAGLGYYQAEKGLSSAQHTVDDAETRLIAARALGDPALVAQAEAELRQARRGIESAVMGDIAAGESLIGTAQSVAVDRRVRPFLLRAQPTIDKAKGIGKGLDDLVHGSDTPDPLRKAAAEDKQLFDQATAGFQQDMIEARGDPAKEERAKSRYEAAVATIDAHQQQIRVALASIGSGSGPGRGAPSAGVGGPGYASMRPTGEGEGPASATEPDAPATASSGRPTPERVGTLSIRPGMTLSEISLRTGVSVEALREFNAAVGNELPGDRQLQIGQQIHVPLGNGWQTNKPMDADQYAALVDQANREVQGLPPIALPQLRVAEVPGIPEGGVIDLPHDRFEALKALDQDFRRIDDDVDRSKGQWIDPSTWVDTKEDDAKYAARDAYKQAADRLQSLLMDGSTTKDQEQQARDDLTRARLAFDQALGVTAKAAAQSDYLTPLKELAQDAQDFLHEKNEEHRAALVDQLTAAGVPPVLVAAATLPDALFDEVVDAVGLGKGIVTQAQNVAGMVAHPIDTFNGLVALHERLQQTDPMWRMSRFMLDLSTGKYATTDEAYAGLLKAADVREMAESGIDLVVDMGKGFLEHPIELAKQGKYTEAWTTLIGENVNVAAVFGWLGRGLKVAERGAELTTATGRAAQAERLAAETRAADLAKAKAAEQATLRGEATTQATKATEGTQAGRTAGTIQPKSAALDESLGPGSPRSPLGTDVRYTDPDPPTYANGLSPDTPVVDHMRARALGGHPTDPRNQNLRAWSENSRKGWHEGNYLRERARLIKGGLTREQAEWVLEDYLRWIETDIHATPVDPKKLKKLPSP